MHRYTLALCGGGAKGAFHIGMWKALHKFHYTEKIEAVSGTSVGALNAVLFALGDFNLAKKIWDSITPDMFLSLNDRGDSIFSSNGLKHIIEELDLSKLKIPVYINIHNTVTNQTESYKLNDYNAAEKCNLLLATTSLPGIYPEVYVNGNRCRDGGIIDLGNVPVEPLYKNGYREIIIASLNHQFNLHHSYDSILKINSVDLTTRYPGCNFKEIVPMKDLGKLFSGTLNFSKTQIYNNMVQGYKDTVKCLNNEDVYVVKNKYSRINMQIHRKMQQLFKSAKEIETFISVTNFSEINIPMGTFGGHVWYETIVNLYGWKVQQHKLVGFQNYYRILDDKNIRRAWVLNPEDIVCALEDYEAERELS